MVPQSLNILSRGRAYCGQAGLMMTVYLMISLACMADEGGDQLTDNFINPPDSAKPRTWWHWVSGNVSSKGITADLNAMKAIGLGGAQIFTVDQSDVKGPVKFLSPEWRKLMHQSLVEASRLNLEISMEGCDGWSESGGHWVTPAQSMQKIVWKEINVTGGQSVSLKLPQPETKLGYYEDIALFAFPTLPNNGASVSDLAARSGMSVNMHLSFEVPSATQDEVIDPKALVDLTGKTEWDAPPGKWTLVRLGHTSTEATTHPSTTPGLECDKMSQEAVKSHIDHLFTPVWKDSPGLVGSTFGYILLDSWEAGCENWTPLLRSEFKQRRGYDLWPWLPTLAGHIILNPDATNRFLWDYRRTLADLVADNHYGTFQQAAHAHHMGLYSEATGIGMPTVADQLQCKGRTDIPMGEFWVNQTGEDNVDDPKEAASAAHIYGQNIAATESFTSNPEAAAWKNDPYSLKQEGDKEFCLGVNRFIFHRYAHQPWSDQVPGMSMGPWGINFERTNTWWNQGVAWISYISRCQYLLQQGRFVADLCYFYGEGAPICLHHTELRPAVPAGYDYDVCNAEILLNQMTVENGEIVLKSGMHYRVLVLPNINRMSLPVLQKIESLVKQGAIVYGPKPSKSPSLAGYPDSDQQIQSLADAVWGNCDGQTIQEHAYGKGRVVWGKGKSLADVMGVVADFASSKPNVLYVHRVDKTSTSDIYFVSNQTRSSRVVECTFRVDGKAPELWFPDSGKIENPALYTTKNGTTTMPIHFDPVGSVFVIFRHAPQGIPVTSLNLEGAPPEHKTQIVIQKAVYGVGNDFSKTSDVRAKIQALVDQGQTAIPVSNAITSGKDPAFGIVKTLNVEYTIDGKPQIASGSEGTSLYLEPVPAFSVSDLYYNSQGTLTFETNHSGHYDLKTADAKMVSCEVPTLPASLDISGPWEIEFPPNRGAPESATFDSLISWTDSPVDGIKYFSGTATYETDVTVPAVFIAQGMHDYLDLGNVKNLAEVKVNGKSLGILWKAPFRVDITDAITPGKNHLEIKITNLWPNRLIGDSKLDESQRITWASVSLYKPDSPLLSSGLLGPVSLETTQQLTLSSQPAH